jgi:hypothetical protein
MEGGGDIFSDLVEEIMNHLNPLTQDEIEWISKSQLSTYEAFYKNKDLAKACLNADVVAGRYRLCVFAWILKYKYPFFEAAKLFPGHLFYHPQELTDVLTATGNLDFLATWPDLDHFRNKLSETLRGAGKTNEANMFLAKAALNDEATDASSGTKRK